jgi:hypothetical protein
MKPKEILWRTRESLELGYVDRFLFFTIEYDGITPKKRLIEGKRWTCKCHLPGVQVTRFTSSKEAKKAAEGLLGEYIERITTT